VTDIPPCKQRNYERYAKMRIRKGYTSVAVASTGKSIVSKPISVSAARSSVRHSIGLQSEIRVPREYTKPTYAIRKIEKKKKKKKINTEQ
jgi:poly-beta-hydroxyalkanoate depolymerase